MNGARSSSRAISYSATGNGSSRIRWRRPRRSIGSCITPSFSSSTSPASGLIAARARRQRHPWDRPAAALRAHWWLAGNDARDVNQRAVLQNRTALRLTSGSRYATYLASTNLARWSHSPRRTGQNNCRQPANLVDAKQITAFSSKRSQFSAVTERRERRLPSLIDQFEQNP